MGTTRRKMIAAIVVLVCVVVVTSGAFFDPAPQDTRTIDPDQRIIFDASFISKCPTISQHTKTEQYERDFYDSDFVQIEETTYRDFSRLLVISNVDGAFVASARSYVRGRGPEPYLPENFMISDRAEFETIGQELASTLTALIKHRAC